MSEQPEPGDRFDSTMVVSALRTLVLATLSSDHRGEVAALQRLSAEERIVAAGALSRLAVMMAREVGHSDDRVMALMNGLLDDHLGADVERGLEDLRGDDG